MNLLTRTKKIFNGQDFFGFLVRGFAGSAGLRMGQALISLATVAVMARGLGPDGYGIYSFAFSIASLLVIPAQMGLPILIVREVARFQLSNDWGLVRGLFRRSNQLIAANSLVLLIAASIYFYSSPEMLRSEEGITLIWALILVPLIALCNLRGAALRGLRKVVQGQLPELLIRPLILLMLLFLALTYHDQINPSKAMSLHVVASLIAFIVGIFMLTRNIPGAVKTSPNQYQTRVGIKSLMPLALIAGLQIINSQIDIVMLGVMRSKSEVGVYRVASQGASIVALALTTVNIVIAPQITRLYHLGDSQSLQTMVTLSSRLILLVALPLIIVLILWGKFLLAWIFGEQFSQGYSALVILCVGQLVNACMGSVAFLLNMTGHEKETVKGVMFAAVCNLALNLVLIPPFGIVGASVSAAVSLIVWNILLYRKVWKHLQIDSMAFRIRYMKKTDQE